jgi:hypothetical protein
MANKNFWLGMLVLTLVFGMTVVGCPPNSDDDSTAYDVTGTWDFTMQGVSVTVTVTGNNWVFKGPIPYYDDTGTFNRNGNIAILYSDTWEANIGITKITSNTTMTLTLSDPSQITGTFNGTKRSGSNSVSLTLTNGLLYRIDYIYVRPSSSSSWGTDRLGSSYLNSGQSITIQVSPGTYDVRAIDLDGDTSTAYNKSITSNITLTFLMYD